MMELRFIEGEGNWGSWEWEIRGRKGAYFRN